MYQHGISYGIFLLLIFIYFTPLFTLSWATPRKNRGLQEKNKERSAASKNGQSQEWSVVKQRDQEVQRLNEEGKEEEDQATFIWGFGDWVLPSELHSRV